MPTTNQLAHNINMAAPKALKMPTQSDTHQKEDELQQAEHTQGHLAAISLWEPSGTYVRALEYYAQWHHLIDFAATTHGAVQNTSYPINRQCMYVYMDTAH